MNFYKAQDFVDDIMSYVKFPFDREDISLEIKDHMIDKIEYYIEKGYDVEESEKLTIKDMGDPKKIGVELNKQHNPIIGWIWAISNTVVVLFIIINILLMVSIIFNYIISGNSVGIIPKENIEYRIDLDERVQIDDRVIRFTNIVYEKDGKLNIFYRDYEKGFRLGGWNFGSLGTIRDDLGNEYPGHSGLGGGGIVSKWIKTIDDFPEDANTLIIDYDMYNRKFKIEIPLKTGENNE